MTYFPAIKAASPVNIVVESPSSSVIDGVNLAPGDQVLLVNQTTASENGIWIFQGVFTPMQRPSPPAPFSIGSSVDSGTVIPVGAGIALGGQKWAITSPPYGGVSVGSSMGFTVDSLGPAGMMTIALNNGMNADVNGAKFGYLEVSTVTGPFQIAGFSDIVPGLERTIFNPSFYPMTLKHEDAVDEATPAFRIHNPNGCDVACTIARLRYSPALQRWLLVSTEPSWSPLQMRDIAGWWRSDAVALDGAGNVQSALDLSGNGLSASQSNAAARPGFSPSGGPNGRPYWTCSGTTSLANATASPIASGQAHTLFAAFQASGVGGSVMTLRSGNPVNCKLYQNYGGTNYVYTDGVNVPDNATIPSLNIGTPVILTVTSQVGSMLAVRVNGSPVTVTASAPVTLDSGPAGFTLVGRPTFSDVGLAGQFYEMFIVGHAATAAEIAIAENYLTQRWQ